MSSSIAAALSALLPSLAPTFPPRLLNQCDSLLALSRQRASQLKQEEEIARAHACCEIACDRLRAQLRLPAPKTGGAACKPTVYKRLKAFLEGVLGDAATTPRKTDATTPGRKRTANREVKTPTTTRSQRIPTSKGNANGFVGKIKAAAIIDTVSGDDAEAPKYVISSIRRLCAAFKTERMVPHVYTATCVGIKRAELWPVTEQLSEQEQAERREEIQSLIIAMYFLVLARMQSAITKDTWAQLSKRALDVLELREERKGAVEGFVYRINEEGWTSDGEWWDSVPEGVLEPVDLGEVNDATEEGDEKKRSHRARQRLKIIEDERDDVLLPGLGTMMSDSVDWLSEQRTAEFKIWKRDMLRKMAVMDQAEVKQGMDAVAAA